MKQSFFSTQKPKVGRFSTLPSRQILSITLSLILAGCASYSSVPAGTPVAEVIKQFGKPAVHCKSRNNLPRLVWTTQPNGETAWATEVSNQGVVNGFEQVLSDEKFSLLSNPGWTKDMIHCEFGPPAEIQDLGFYDKHTVWTYRYMSHRMGHSLMTITYGDDGITVLRYRSILDPVMGEAARGYGPD
jgi:hypothetical protein